MGESKATAGERKGPDHVDQVTRFLSKHAGSLEPALPSKIVDKQPAKTRAHRVWYSVHQIALQTTPACLGFSDGVGFGFLFAWAGVMAC